MTLKRLMFVPAVLALCALAAIVGSLVQPGPADAQQVMIYSKTYDAASTVDAAGITTTINAPGAVLGDFCVASVSVDVVSMSITCYISAAGVASVRMQNESTATVDLASSTWRVIIWPHGTR